MVMPQTSRMSKNMIIYGFWEQVWHNGACTCLSPIPKLHVTLWGFTFKRHCVLRRWESETLKLSTTRSRRLISHRERFKDRRFELHYCVTCRDIISRVAILYHAARYYIKWQVIISNEALLFQIKLYIT